MKSLDLNYNSEAVNAESLTLGREGGGWICSFVRDGGAGHRQKRGTNSEVIVSASMSEPPVIPMVSKETGHLQRSF